MRLSLPGKVIEVCLHDQEVISIIVWSTEELYQALGPNMLKQEVNYALQLPLIEEVE